MFFPPREIGIKHEVKAIIIDVDASDMRAIKMMATKWTQLNVKLIHFVSGTRRSNSPNTMVSNQNNQIMNILFLIIMKM